jgi:hypothetical protein
MDSEAQKKDLLLLNALVDGELAPAERAELAGRLAVERDLARTYATLARLKAATAETVGESPAIDLTRKTPARWPRVMAGATGLAAALALAAFAAVYWPAEGEQGFDRAEGPTAITLASLPAGTTVPRLDTAGLKLVGLAIDPGKVPLFTASYRGPHGCRLDLRAWPAGSAAPPALDGTLRFRWATGDLVYEMVAHGMPQWRFTIISGAAEDQTRAGSDHDRIDRRLREAHRGAPPCVG